MAVNGYAAAQDVADLKVSTAALAVAMGQRVNTNEASIAVAQAAVDALPEQLEALENSIAPIAIAEGTAAGTAAANAVVALMVPKNTDGSDFVNPASVRESLGAVSTQALAAAIVDSPTVTVVIHCDEALGDDTLGDGSELTPFATANRAVAAVPLLTWRGSVIIRPVGDVTDSWRADMDRPALIYIDGIKIGRRTAQSGATLSGGLIIDLTYATVKPGTSFPRGIYATGHCGSVAVVGGSIIAQAGAESLIVAHRGAYVHIRNTICDGNAIASLGLLAEAGGIIEAIDVSATGSTADAVCYANSFIQMAAPAGLAEVGTISNGGGVDLAVGMSCTGTITNRANLSFTGTLTYPIKLSGNYSGSGGRVTGAYVHMINSAASIVAAAEQWKVDALHSNAQLNFYSTNYQLNAFQSYVAPATQSTFEQPIRSLLGSNAAFSLSMSNKNSAGAIVGPDFGPQTVTVAADATVIPVTLNGENPQVIRLNNTKGSLATGCTLSLTNENALAGTIVNNGQMITLVNLGGNGVQIVHGSTAVGMNGSNFVIGASAGQRRALTLVYLTNYGKWMPIAPDEMVTLTAPSVTYVAPAVTYAAPAGGAVVDTEARAAIAQLAADLAATRAALAAQAADTGSIRSRLSTGRFTA